MAGIELAPIVPVGNHTVNSSLSSAATLTKPAGAKNILVQALTQNIRFTLDGTTPTSTTGFQLKAGDPPMLIPVFAATIKFIEETATATLQYQWSGV